MQASQHLKTLPISKFLIGGIMAGVVALILNNLWFVIYESLTDYAKFEELNVFSISLMSVLPVLVGALVYYGLTRFVPQMATRVFVVGGLLFGLLSLGGPFNPDMAEGFAGAAAPMHIIGALACVLLVPYFVNRES